MFTELGLLPELLRAVEAEGYTTPTPIQQKAIPIVLRGGDLLGLAQTGTGKTAAFALPILQRLRELGVRPQGRRPIAVLVLTPTRELASQIGDSFARYGKHMGFAHTVIFGGVGHEPQRRAVRHGLDILVATPGRLLDLCNEGVVTLDQIAIFVLDEADRMLDMGFIHDVKRIIAKLPRRRQTLFFSATMPAEAQSLADALLTQPETVAVTPVSSTAERILQRVMFVDKNDKRAALEQLLLEHPEMRRVLVFTRMKHQANRVAEYLDKAGIKSAAIHGNKSQGARERALLQFKQGTVRVLVATDIAARGIDIDDITHVVNADLPEVPETYVHRIGRTARAGADGKALSLVESEDVALLRAIERLIKQEVPVLEGTSVPGWAHTGGTARAPRGGGGGGGRRDGGRSGGGGGGGRRDGGRSFGGGGGDGRRDRPGHEPSHAPAAARGDGGGGRRDGSRSFGGGAGGRSGGGGAIRSFGGGAGRNPGGRDSGGRSFGGGPGGGNGGAATHGASNGGARRDGQPVRTSGAPSHDTRPRDPRLDDFGRERLGARRR